MDMTEEEWADPIGWRPSKGSGHPWRRYGSVTAVIWSTGGRIFRVGGSETFYARSLEDARRKSYTYVEGIAAPTAMMLKVYLAGKMHPKHDWRDEASPLLRDVGRGISLMAGSSIADEVDRAVYAAAFGSTQFDVVGPFPGSCDHGCGHHRGSLHMGETCSDATIGDVFDACLTSIAKCDLFCAHLHTGDEHGTLVEIGIARGLGKPILVTLSEGLASATRRGSIYGDDDSKVGRHDLWFPMIAATQSAIVADHAAARRQHATWIAQRSEIRARRKA